MILLIVGFVMYFLGWGLGFFLDVHCKVSYKGIFWLIGALTGLFGTTLIAMGIASFY